VTYITGNHPVCVTLVWTKLSSRQKLCSYFRLFLIPYRWVIIRTSVLGNRFCFRILCRYLEGSLGTKTRWLKQWKLSGGGEEMVYKLASKTQRPPRNCERLRSGAWEKRTRSSRNAARKLLQTTNAQTPLHSIRISVLTCQHMMRTVRSAQYPYCNGKFSQDKKEKETNGSGVLTHVVSWRLRIW
jgi:hypothetical protein